MFPNIEAGSLLTGPGRFGLFGRFPFQSPQPWPFEGAVVDCLESEEVVLLVISFDEREADVVSSLLQSAQCSGSEVDGMAGDVVCGKETVVVSPLSPQSSQPRGAADTSVAPRRAIAGKLTILNKESKKLKDQMLR
jgi:hypothetical protein